MRNPPWSLLVRSDPPNIYYLNRLSISSPMHFVLSLYDKVEKIVIGNPSKWINFFCLSIIRSMHLVPSLYDKVEKLVMGESPKTPLVKLDHPNNFLNHHFISSPMHLIPSLYDKVEKIVVGNHPKWNNFFMPFNYLSNEFGPVSIQ